MNRPGVYTTEFWTTIITGIYFVLNSTGALDEIPQSWSAIGLAIVTALYGLSRGWAKSNGTTDQGTGLFGLGKGGNE